MLQEALLALASQAGPGAFAKWVEERLGQTEVLDGGEGLWKGEMMRLLGVSQNAFQWWESHAEEMGYPALDVPRKTMPGTSTVARFYPQALAVKVLKWYWEKEG